MNFSTINMQSSNGTNHTLERKDRIKYFTKQSLSLSNTPQIFMVYLKVNALRVNYRIYQHEFTNNEREISIPYEVDDCGIENFEFIISERVQVNPDNSLAGCVNIFIIQTEYTAKKNRRPKPWCNDSGVLNLQYARPDW